MTEADQLASLIQQYKETKNRLLGQLIDRGVDVQFLTGKSLFELEEMKAELDELQAELKAGLKDQCHATKA